MKRIVEKRVNVQDKLQKDSKSGTLVKYFLTIETEGKWKWPEEKYRIEITEAEFKFIRNFVERIKEEEKRWCQKK